VCFLGLLIDSRLTNLFAHVIYMSLLIFCSYVDSRAKVPLHFWFYFILISCFDDTGVWTQSLSLARKEPYHLSFMPAFMLYLFLNRILCLCLWRTGLWFSIMLPAELELKVHVTMSRFYWLRWGLICDPSDLYLPNRIIGRSHSFWLYYYYR
jgi:hypothetical protein